MSTLEARALPQVFTLPAKVRAGAGLIAAALLAWLCVAVNTERACTLDETLHLPMCEPAASAGEDSATALRGRIARNPGDAAAYVELALASNPPADAGALAAASRLAPQDRNVLMMRAMAALVRGDGAAAVGPLVDLAEYRDDPAAAVALARLIAAGHGQLLAPHIAPGNGWFLFVLKQLRHIPGGLSTALPLIAQALNTGGLERNAVPEFIRDLKAAGAWTDAYALWLALHPQGLPVLFNASFEKPFDESGFDWEAASAGPRAGATVGRQPSGARGMVLEIRMTGRSMTMPLVRQYLFLGEGRYRLRGDYRTNKLRMEQGLAWVVRCTRSSAVAGRSPAMEDTRGDWRTFGLEFALPPGCGEVASLQLETYAPYEAQAGAQGQVALDAMILEKLAN